MQAKLDSRKKVKTESKMGQKQTKQVENPDSDKKNKANRFVELYLKINLNLNAQWTVVDNV